MRTYITLPNEQAELFEAILEEFNLLGEVESIRERDFMTDFIFEDLNEQEEAQLELLKNNLESVNNK